MAAASILFACMTSSAGAVTLHEAQTLPVPELVRMVLGNTAEPYVAVRRPTGFESAGNFIPPGYTKSLSSMTFYGEPRPLKGTGVCEATVLWVSFDTAGNPTRQDSSTIYNAGGERIADAPASPGAAAVSRAKARCAALVPPLGFFDAPNPTVAVNTAVAVQALIDEHARGAAVNLKYVCKSDTPCPGIAHAFDRIALENISSVYDSDCKDDPQIHQLAISNDQSCYSITMNLTYFSTDHLDIVVNRKSDVIYIQSAMFYANGMIVH